MLTPSFIAVIVGSVIECDICILSKIASVLHFFQSVVSSERVTLKTVLYFFTGAEAIPPGGYGALVYPCVNFNDEQPYPTASTCAITLTLPTKYCSTYSSFKSAMDTAMLCHGGFGLV